MARREALTESLLQAGRGAFVISRSPDPQLAAYILTLNCDNTVRDFNIIDAGASRGFHLEHSQWCFATLEDLVEYYARAADETLPCFLRVPQRQGSGKDTLLHARSPPRGPAVRSGRPESYMSSATTTTGFHREVSSLGLAGIERGT